MNMRKFTKCIIDDILLTLSLVVSESLIVLIHTQKCIYRPTTCELHLTNFGSEFNRFNICLHMLHSITITSFI